MPAATVSTRHAEHPSTCPRCGYDLRGVIAMWADACPLTGTCSECGLEFSWIDVLDPNRQGPAWSIEFTRGRTAWVRGALHTFARSLIPWHFWNRLRMEHPVNGPRLVIYVIGILVLVTITYWIGHSIWLARYWDARFEIINRTSATVDTTAFNAWVRSTLMPLSGTPVGTGPPHPNWGGGVLQLESPFEVLRFRMSPPAYPALSRTEPPIVGFLFFFVYPATVVIGWLIGLFLIPRRMQTRSILASHLFRLFAISAMFLVLARIAPLLMHSIVAIEGRDVVRGETPNYFFLSIPIAVGFMTIWWIVACRSYLRLKNWVRMGLAVSLFGFIALPMLIVLVVKAVL